MASQPCRPRPPKEQGANLVELVARYGDEDKARQTLEEWRWSSGVVCPHCGAIGDNHRIISAAGSKTRRGVWRCHACKKQFTVTVGTIFEDSHIPLGKWLAAVHLMCASKKGISARQLHQVLRIKYQSAWFMAHRLRAAMSRPPLADMLNGLVEAGETFVGGNPQNRHVGKHEGATDKIPVMALVERGVDARSFPVPTATG